MHKSYHIATLPGDGTGPEVLQESVKVLKAASDRYDFKLHFHSYPFGGEHYLRTEELLPDSTLNEIRRMQGILFGEIGHPGVKPGILEKGILIRLRQELDQYIYLRPVRLYPGVISPLRNKGSEHIDFVVVRENTGGLYSGIGGVSMKGTAHEVAQESMVYTRHQVERCVRYAYEYARGRDEKSIALCGKTSVLTHVYDLWSRVFRELGDSDFLDVGRTYYHIDEMCMQMVKYPEKLNVIVTGDMFGDILGDLGAALQGGVGFAAGGNINPGGVSMFGPIGGDFASQFHNYRSVNPIAAISAGAMLLRNLGEFDAAEAIDRSVMTVAATKIATLGSGLGNFVTKEVGDMVSEGL